MTCSTFSGRSLLRQRVVALAGALVELALQLRVGALQIGYRLVERRGHLAYRVWPWFQHYEALVVYPSRTREQSFIRSPRRVRKPECAAWFPRSRRRRDRGPTISGERRQTSALWATSGSDEIGTVSGVVASGSE
jgi:hypothetical protein